jgi:hypothetical protein
LWLAAASFRQPFHCHAEQFMIFIGVAAVREQEGREHAGDEKAFH